LEKTWGGERGACEGYIIDRLGGKTKVWLKKEAERPAKGVVVVQGV
jgi:hypothetical protein